ncbi:hypothetical protein TeGR_g1930, partial [Tetraparma gracilis]
MLASRTSRMLSASGRRLAARSAPAVSLSRLSPNSGPSASLILTEKIGLPRSFHSAPTALKSAAPAWDVASWTDDFL